MSSAIRGLRVILKLLCGGLLLLLCLLLGPAWLLLSQQVDWRGDWQHASRSVSGLAPDPATTPAALVQVYAARAFAWRGAFGVHTWIATKAEHAAHYRVYQVVSWRRPTVQVAVAQPDRAWYGNPPELLAELRGAPAARAIATIEQVVPSYPQAGHYRIWPGPNSNTFVAWVVRQVPELAVDFPANAIGKDYLLDGPLARAPSHSGYQLSLGGLVGVTAAWEEGVEFNLLGLGVGVDLDPPALRLPGIGRLGMVQPPRRDEQ
ncbi:DUF3750 domain-containing protein [Salinicola endophyticus]|uniref:DUF3750 domain-containing protein n=1 Tax=Salinicola endophyticus TaxID=1949083 RepID=A0AB74U9I1_9GAMM